MRHAFVDIADKTMCSRCGNEVFNVTEECPSISDGKIYANATREAEAREIADRIRCICLLATRYPISDKDAAFLEGAAAFIETVTAPARVEAGDSEYIAILERHDRTIQRAILVPYGQSLEFDEGTICRAWLSPYLGTKWHLVAFVCLTPTESQEKS